MCPPTTHPSVNPADKATACCLSDHRTSEPKPRAPRGEGRGSKAKRESADGAAAAAAAAGGGSDAGDPPAAVDAEPAAAPAAAAVLPAVQAVKHERSSSSPTAAQAKAGFGGLGAHPFLAARTFGKAGAKKGGSSPSPKPESPLKQQQKPAGPAAAAPAGAAAMAPGQQQQQLLPPQVPQQQQQQQGEEQSQYAQVAPSLLPGLSAKLLAGFAAPQQPNAAEDDYDDDYDS